MSQDLKISSALVSVFDKEGLLPLLDFFRQNGVIVYSTGGTASFLRKNEIKVKPIESITGYPSILGGRVKTLHPKIFGGLLSRKNHLEDREECNKYDIPRIDMVIVDLYPFEKTVASKATEQDIIEKIDIGGVSLIRAAAKNFQDVFCVSSVDQYSEALSLLSANDGQISLTDRKRFAAKAFNVSSHYDTAIFDYFDEEESVTLKISSSKYLPLRYGENPHQKASFYGDLEELLEKLNGKQMSYNNLLDVDVAMNMMYEFREDPPTFAILKHNNACGLAQDNTISEAYDKALQADPVSAFGGVMIANTTIDETTAKKLDGLFFEVLIAPSYDVSALNILRNKKNRILLKYRDWSYSQTQYLRTCLNGILTQQRDTKTDGKHMFEVKTKQKPTENQIEDLIFASKICKHTKSNAIVLAKNKQLIAGGTGQTSRVYALEQAIDKAKHFEFELEGAVMASDAFFPFPDCVMIAAKEGISSIVQPGGSIKDNLSIEACDNEGISMIFTGIRHFKH